MISKKIIRLGWEYLWVLLAALSLVLRKLLAMQPEWVETVYSRGVFKGVRWGFYYLSWCAPFPLMYVFIAIFLVVFASKMVRVFQKNNPKKVWQVIKKLLNALGFLVFGFMILWGYNYLRPPIEQQLGIFPKPLTIGELRDELGWATQLLLQKEQALPSYFRQAKTDIHTLQEPIETAVQSFLYRQGYPLYPSAKGRVLVPKGVLLRNGTAGIYFPYVGESNIDGGLHWLTQPYTLAHELGHAYGFGDEGTCNFIAYMACTTSKHPLLEYCGVLGYWRTVAGQYKAYQPNKYAAFRKTLPPTIIQDLNDINATHRQYPDIFPKLRDATYDQFLKAQGIQEGLENYNRVIMLVRAMRTKYE